MRWFINKAILSGGLFSLLVVLLTAGVAIHDAYSIRVDVYPTGASRKERYAGEEIVEVWEYDPQKRLQYHRYFGEDKRTHMDYYNVLTGEIEKSSVEDWPDYDLKRTID